MSVELITILMFALLMVLICTGLPLVFCLGFSAILFTFLLWGPSSLVILTTAASGYMNNFVLICIPLFIFMAYFLEKSGVADSLYAAMHNWFGPVRGGLAMGTVAICTIFAAMSGVSAAGTLTMGLVALPNMLKRGYDKGIACGCILAGGALGILIPPSVAMVIYCILAQVSIGKMFIAGIVPGIMTSLMFMGYIAIRCGINPRLGPALSVRERGTLRDKFVSLKSIILPALIILAVLGAIFTGIATPTEASAIGAFACILATAINRKLSWENIQSAAQETLKPTGMVMWIMIAAATFSSVYTGLGATQVIQKTITGLNVNPLLIIIAMQVVIFLLGMILDPNGITLITLPIYVPIVTALGYDLTWFGILYVMNMECAYITPPFGWNLFYLKGIAPPNISIQDIYRSVWPFVAVQVLALLIVLFIPAIALYLPGLMAS